MQRPWTVRNGRDFAQSRRECLASGDRIDMHLVALRIDLRRDPYAYGEAYDSEAKRVIETKDRFGDGFVLSAIVTVDVAAFVVTDRVDHAALTQPGRRRRLRLTSTIHRLRGGRS